MRRDVFLEFAFPNKLPEFIIMGKPVLMRAIGSATPKPASTVFRAQRGVDQNNRMDGLPLGTRGGISVEHMFPVDAQYDVRVDVSGVGNWTKRTGKTEKEPKDHHDHCFAMEEKAGPRIEFAPDPDVTQQTIDHA